MTLARVASYSNPGQVAGAIAHIVRSGDHPELQAIGEKAIHLSVKAIILANVYLQPEGLELSCVPRWKQLVIQGKERSAGRFAIHVRRLDESSAETPSEPAASGTEASSRFAPPAGVPDD